MNERVFDLFLFFIRGHFFVLFLFFVLLVLFHALIYGFGFAFARWGRVGAERGGFSRLKRAKLGCTNVKFLVVYLLLVRRAGDA